MMAVDHFARYADLNPVSDAEALPDSAWADADLLEVIDRRSAGDHEAGSPPTPPKRWKGPLVAVAVMAAVVIIGVATLLATVARPDTAGEPEPTPTTTAPEPLPELSGDAGSLDTSLGPVTWIRASAGENLLPWPAIQTPTGFAGVVYAEDSAGRYSSRWTTSPDGVTWSVEPFPVPVDEEAFVQVGEADGRYWLTDGASLWLSDGAEGWAAADLSAFRPPPSTGLLWDSGIEPPRHPAVAGSATVFPWSAHPVLAVSEIFDIPSSAFTGGVRAVSCGWFWDPPCEADDEHVVVGVDAETGEETVLARFRVQGDGGTAVVVDVDTRTRLHEFTVAGFSGDQLASRWDTDYVVWNAVGVVGPDHRVTAVEPPWSAFGIRSVAILAVEDRFLAYIDTGDPHGATTLDAIEVWESVDGVTWTSRSPVDFGIELSGEMNVLQLFQRRGHLIADIEYDLDQSLPSTTRVTSTDGINWEPTSPTAPADVEPVRNGFIAIGDRLWVSADGSTWEELTILDRPSDDVLVVGDTLIVVYESDGTYETWAFDLEP